MACGSAIALGEEVHVGYQISYAGYAYFVRHYDVITGSYLGLGVVGTNIECKKVWSVEDRSGENQNCVNRSKWGRIKTFDTRAVIRRYVCDRYYGFSAAKSLSTAAAKGQRIYTITPATQNIALPNIRLDATSMSEIRAALASGKHVTTHTDLLTVPGFKGAGYDC